MPIVINQKVIALLTLMIAVAAFMQPSFLASLINPDRLVAQPMVQECSQSSSVAVTCPSNMDYCVPLALCQVDRNECLRHSDLGAERYSTTIYGGQSMTFSWAHYADYTWCWVRVRQYQTLKECADSTWSYDCPDIGVPEPDKPVPSTIGGLLLVMLRSWLESFFSFFGLASLTGVQTAAPNTQMSVIVDMAVLIDADCSDGSCQFQYGGWTVYDSDLNVVTESEWEEVHGSYQTTATFTSPSALGKYAFVAVVYEYDMLYADGWTISSEHIAAKEAHLFMVTVGEPIVPAPPSNFFTELLAGIIEWLIGLFALLECLFRGKTNR